MHLLVGRRGGLFSLQKVLFLQSDIHSPAVGTRGIPANKLPELPMELRTGKSRHFGNLRFSL